VEKYSKVGEATNDNMAQVNFALSTEAYGRTLDDTIIFIAFSLQQWLHERTSTLRYTNTVCLVIAS